jgi:hypothetical protein
MPTTTGRRGGAIWGNRKPPPTARVDWSHPMARELRLQYLFNEGTTGAGPTTTGTIRDACRGLPATMILGGGSPNPYVPHMVAPGLWNAPALEVWDGVGGGIAGRIAVANDAIYKPTAALTLMGWHKPVVAGNTPCLLCLDYRNDGTWSTPFVAYALVAGSGTDYKPVLDLALGTGTLVQCGASTSLTGFNKWYHIAGTYDGATMKIYWNGDLYGTESTSGAINYGNNGPLCLGDISTRATLPNPTQVATGPLEDLRVYGRALSQAEIRSAMYDPFSHLIPGGAMPGPRAPVTYRYRPLERSGVVNPRRVLRTARSS